MLSFRMRRCLISFLFDKVTKLSVKSMTETNSGKLISMISSDLFHIERGVALYPLLFAAPFINIWAFYLIVDTVGWTAAAIVFAFQVLTTIL